MKKALFTLIAASVASFAQAESTTYKVSGMHCVACVNMTKSTVCKLEGIEKCDVTLGKIVITPKARAKISKEQVQDALTKAGDYSITEITTTK